MNDASRALDAAFRDEWARLVASLIGWCRDFELAEDGAQEAFVDAARTWPRDGVPDRPGAWLVTAARRRVLDRMRRDRLGEARLAELAVTEEGAVLDPDLDAVDSGIGDERLRLIFTCCHPALAFESRVALTLRTLAGLTTAEIARAFGVPEPTMAKRLVRAKHKIRDAGIPYRIPPAHLLPERTTSVLAVIYLLFNEGYAASSGDALTRPDLEGEAVRLASLVVELMPDDAEARGLLALVLLHQARAGTRVSDNGVLVALEEQDRGRWDGVLIARGLSELHRAARRERLGPYQLQAMIAATHVTAPTPELTDWSRIVDLYDALVDKVPSPTVRLNRVVAVAMRDGPDAGLAVLEALAKGDPADAADPPSAPEVSSGALPPGHLVPSVRADLHRRAGRSDDARRAYDEALALVTNDAERRYLQRRRAALD
ncbi:RNA polymerase sigma factor [Knoellia sp. CPCC 206453]|uniref:RNA polymerase sigma factor n=1 Tax=Knoellia pratensis TaxID=3404796 RepID=UPI00361E7CA8